MKQIVLQLDEDRYRVLVRALTCISDQTEWTANPQFATVTEREQVMAEQLKGLVMTQYTGSREEIKSNIMPVHEYVPDEVAGVCKRCGLSSRHNIHNLEVSLEQVAKIATKFDEVVHGEKKPIYFHNFEPSTNEDGTPNYKRCAICHKGQKAKPHSLDR